MKVLLFAIVTAVVCCGCSDSPEPLATFVITINGQSTEVVGRSLTLYRWNDGHKNPHKLYVKNSFGWSEKQIYDVFIYPGDTVSITLKTEQQAPHENK